MRVYLPRLDLGPWIDGRVDDLTALAEEDQFAAHSLADNPDEADVVLFLQCHMVDWRLRAIREHPVAVRQWQKVMVYDERAIHWKSFPGIYVSPPASSFDTRTQRVWSYIRIPSEVQADVFSPDLLFSFVGSATDVSRRPLLDLHHPNAVIEGVTNFMFWDISSPGYEQHRQRYQEILSRSRFVLCPRGTGTSSFRLYETMAAGRVPVIIADGWIPPRGPRWDEFSLRFPEGSTDGLVELLETADSSWESMSTAAAAAYAEFFSPRVMFHRLVEEIRLLHESEPPRRSHRAMERRSMIAAAAERLRKIPIGQRLLRS